MKKCILFCMDGCPYCRYAERALRELKAERREYGEIFVEWIEETRHPEISEKYDYYYVPSLFYGGEKLYEAHPSERYEDCKQNLRAALDRILLA